VRIQPQWVVTPGKQTTNTYNVWTSALGIHTYFLAKRTCHKWPDSACVLEGEAMKATNVQAGETDSPPTPALLKPQSLPQRYAMSKCKHHEG